MFGRRDAYDVVIGSSKGGKTYMDRRGKAKPFPVMHIEQFESHSQIFELGEAMMRTYTLDSLEEREKVYSEVIEFRKMTGVNLNEAYLREHLPANLFESYLNVKESYLHSIDLGDTYDNECNSFYFHAEATAYRAYLLTVLQLIYAKGHLFKKPLPKRLVTEMHIHCEPNLSPGPATLIEGKEDHRRPEGRRLFDFNNDCTLSDDE